MAQRACGMAELCASRGVPFLYVRRGTHDIELPEHTRLGRMGCLRLKFRGDAIFTNAATSHYEYIDDVLNDVYGKDLAKMQTDEPSADVDVNNPLNKKVRFDQPLRGTPSRQQRNKENA